MIINYEQGGQSGNNDMLGGMLSGLPLVGGMSGMLNAPFGMINNLGIMGGLAGKPGAIEGLFNKDAPKTGLNGLWDFFGLSGRLPKGWIATGRDALPIAGSVIGNMFMPGFGGPIGSMAGKMGSSMLLGNEGTNGAGYWNNYLNNNSNI